ncbi:hypothetical protein FHU38_000789 [Saccharomonospora amisosensis]|uniref:Uncharacterized protein n=1 Tax=Saccharomonospora amisosensis TaxID=1128677 RepID=A0A7X5ULX0_9PSEU|nr:hypothetical protein [Saccharomonospora amisosensis]NIJ10445.1 hypothetical protein [Saccharomonospora amisosensis]
MNSLVAPSAATLSATTRPNPGRRVATRRTGEPPEGAVELRRLRAELGV